jgi:hypothetical protein
VFTPPLRSKGRCLQSHRLVTGLYATIRIFKRTPGLQAVLSLLGLFGLITSVYSLYLTLNVLYYIYFGNEGVSSLISVHYKVCRFSSEHTLMLVHQCETETYIHRTFFLQGCLRNVWHRVDGFYLSTQHISLGSPEKVIVKSPLIMDGLAQVPFGFI